MRFWRCASERAQAQAVAAEARAADRGAAPRPTAIAVLVRSAGERRRRWWARRWRSARVPFRLHGLGGLLPARRGARRAGLAAAAGRPGRLRRRGARAVAAAGGAALGGHRAAHPARAAAQARHALGGGGRARGAAAHPGGARPRAGLPAPVPAGLRGVRGPPPRRVRAAADRAHRHPPPAGVRHPGRHGRAAAQHREAARAGHRVHAPRAGATPRDFARYLKAVADSGLREEEAPAADRGPGGRGADHRRRQGARVRPRVRARPGRRADARRDPEPTACRRAAQGAPAGGATRRLRRLLYVAITRAREGVVCWAEGAATRAPSPFSRRRARRWRAEERFEEELFGPGEGLHSTFRIMRDELLDTVSHVGGRLGEMRLDTGVDVSHAVARFLELVKVAALIDRSKAGQAVERGAGGGERAAGAGRHAPSSARCWTPRRSTTGCATRGRDPAQRPRRRTAPSRRSTRSSPRRGDGLMLSASDIETYRLCPLKYKFARVFRIPQEPTIHQRFGIALHQVLERFHQYGARHARGAVRAVRVLLAARRLRRLRRRAAVPRARPGGARPLLGALPRRRRRAGVVRAQLLVQARRPRAARARGPRGPPARRQLRADRLQDGQGRAPRSSCARTCSCRSTRWARASRGSSRPRRRATCT